MRRLGERELNTHTLPQWLSPDIITAMKTRDNKIKEKKFEN